MSMTAGGKGITAEINVTPLIDVVLVLLIIFMVITPMLQRGFPVQLPRGDDPAKKPDGADDIIVSVEYIDDDNFALHYQTDPVPKERLIKLLEDLYERAPSTALYIKADKRLKYGFVKETMLLCESAGFREVALVAKAQ